MKENPQLQVLLYTATSFLLFGRILVCLNELTEISLYCTKEGVLFISSRFIRISIFLPIVYSEKAERMFSGNLMLFGVTISLSLQVFGTLF